MKLKYLVIHGFILGSIALSACSSRKIKNESHSDLLLFPYGTYQHQVKIKTELNGGADVKEFSFYGVVQTSQDWVKISMLSPFGTTLVKIQEERQTGKVEFTCFVEAIRKYESKFKDYYSVLRTLLLAPQNPKKLDHLRITHQSPEGLPAEIETVDLEQNAQFRFNKYDEHKIPERIQVQNPKFLIEIQVSGYDI
jgi:hypothetical protein